jgi:triacylglycerol lipase
MKPFILGADRVSNAFYLAHASAAAYEGAPDDYASFAGLQLAEVRTFAGADDWTRGFVGVNDAHLVIVFRGTDRPEDWITNLKYAQVEGYGGKVHRGFSLALDSIWDEVHSRVKTLRTNGQRIWLAGHSLGGALATLAARRLETPYQPHAVYTFGQPRVGDPAFAANYPATLYRFVNNRDIVPNFPLPGVFHRYRHVGRLHWLDAEGRLYRKHVADWLPAAALALTALGTYMAGRKMERKTEKIIQAGIEDHRIENYIKKIKANLPHDSKTR